MIRETSKLAYEYIKESGVLAKRQKQAYLYLYEHGPLTGQELTNGAGVNGLWKICSVLKSKGVVKEVGKTKCSITGRDAYLWDVTKNTPKDPPKRKTKDQIIKELKKENRALRKELKNYRKQMEFEFEDDNNH